MLLGRPRKNLKSYDTPFMGFEQRYQQQQEEEEEERLIIKNSGHLRLCQQPRAAHALRSTKIVAYGCFDETVCTAPLGPIGNFLKFPLEKV